MKLHRLYQFFTERENVLVLPSMWEDPFENFILKAKTRDRDGTVCEFGFHDRLYASAGRLKEDPTRCSESTLRKRTMGGSTVCVCGRQ